MIKKASIAIIYVICSWFISVFTLYGQGLGTNLDFENGLTGWTLWEKSAVELGYPPGTPGEAGTGELACGTNWYYGITAYSGNCFFGVAANYKSKNGGAYQQISGVTPGQTYTLSAWIRTYMSGRNDPNADQWSILCFIGIDPTGGTDPLSSNIVWSDGEFSDDAWKRIEVSAVAQSSIITIFLKHVQKWNIEWNISCFDKLEVTAGGGGGGGDTTPPAAVNNLQATPGPNAGEVSLTWTSPGDDGNVGNLTGNYRIQYNTANSGWNISSAQITISTYNVPPNTLQSRIVSNLTGGVTYYFALWSCDEVNNCSSISNIAYTYAKPSSETPPLSAPDLISPTNGSSINVTKPTFSWNPVQVPGASITYFLQVDDDINFNSPNINETTSNTSFTPTTDLTKGTTYYWRVRAVDNTGRQSSWSQMWSFYIISEAVQPLPAPNLISPINGYLSTTTRPTFSWSPVQAPGASITYLLQVDNDISFSSPDINSATSDTYLTSPVELTRGTTYYWRVRAQDNTGRQSAWSQVRSFYIYKAEEMPSFSTGLQPPAPNIVKLEEVKQGKKIKLKYTLSEARKIELKIYTLTGELVKTFVDKEIKEEGEHEEVWDVKDINGNYISCGVYVVYFKAGMMAKIEKIIVIR
jgi:hypothetical protein